MEKQHLAAKKTIKSGRRLIVFGGDFVPLEGVIPSECVQFDTGNHINKRLYGVGVFSGCVVKIVCNLTGAWHQGGRSRHLNKLHLLPD